MTFESSLSLGVAAARLRTEPGGFGKTEAASDDQLTLILGSYAVLSCLETG